MAGQLKKQVYKKLYFVLGVVADKELDHILPLLPREAHYLFTQAALPRALAAERLAEVCRAAGLRGETVASVPRALDRARALAGPEDLVFIGGSTFTVAEVL